MAAKNGVYVIGCKLPSGFTITHIDGTKHHLNGAKTSRIYGGYGVTENVPAAVWDAYSKTHEQANIIKNGTLFSVGDVKSASDAAKERENIKTGFEQLDPSKLSTKPDKEGV